MNLDDTLGLPTNLQTEVTVLGAMLLDGEALAAALEKLEWWDFALDSHQTIFKAMRELVKAGTHVDLITVMDALQRGKKLDSIGGAGYLAYLTEGIPRNPNVQSYIGILRDDSMRRQMLEVFQEGMTRCADRQDDVEIVLSDVEAKLHKASMRSQDEPTLAEQAEAEYDQLERERRGERAVFLPSGVSKLDEVHGGYAIGEMTMLAARPNVGKSTLLRQSVRENCKAGNFVHLFSPEMRAGKVLRCLWAAEAGVAYSSVRHPVRMSREEFARVNVAMKEVAAWPLLIEDFAGMSYTDVLTRARRVKREKDTKLTALDYLQQLEFKGGPLNRAAEISAAGRALADLAKEGTAVVVVSALTEEDGKKSSIPTMHNLRGSGDLKYAADTVYLLHRELDAETQKLAPKTLLVAGKSRSDVTGSSEIYFHGAMQVFEDWETYSRRLNV